VLNAQFHKCGRGFMALVGQASCLSFVSDRRDACPTYPSRFTAQDLETRLLSPTPGSGKVRELSSKLDFLQRLRP
jgi:hypothetical protein